MKTFLKYTGIVILVLLAVLVIAFWTPDTDKTEMIAKYSGDSSHFVSDRQGMEIHYRDVGQKDAPVIMLVHGSGSSLQTWTDMADQLSGRYRLIALDLPGHGLTGPDPLRDYSAASMMDAVETVMDAAGVERAFIAGNSMGGWTAWRFALASPERTAGLILIDASGPQITDKPNLYLAARITRSKLGRTIGKYITPRALVGKTLTQVMYDETQITDALIDRYWELTRYPGNRQAMIDRSKTDREPEYWDRVSEISAPALILWGEHDVTTPLSFAAAFDAQIENTKLIIYPDAAHLPMEEIPTKVARDINAWMQETYAGDGN